MGAPRPRLGLAVVAMSRAPKGTPTETNLSVLLDYIDGCRESSIRNVDRPLKRIVLGMSVNLGRVAPVSAPHLRRCIKAGLLASMYPNAPASSWFVLTQKGVDMLREYCASYPTLDRNADRIFDQDVGDVGSDEDERAEARNREAQTDHDRDCDRDERKVDDRGQLVGFETIRKAWGPK